MLESVARLKQRLSGRPDSEHGQVLVRIVITALFSIYLSGQLGSADSSSGTYAIWLILVAELLLSLALLVGILLQPRVSHVRRWIGMLADYAAIGAVMCIGGEPVTPLYSVYLWVTIGNGLRYGTRYLYAATVLASLSFLLAIQLTPYWQANAYLAWGLLIGLIAIPLYFAALLKALTRAIDDARRANAAKSRFLANMSHEFRTPLNGIIGMAELLVTGKLSREERESAEVIHTSAQTLLLLVEDVLDISAIEAGKLRSVREVFELQAILVRVRRMLLPQATAKGLDLQIDCDVAMPPVLHGDAEHLQQVLLNLLQNAVKFTERGHVMLQVRVVGEVGADSLTARFSVRDTGIGIPAEARVRIFDAFEQVESGRNRRYGGTGLGTTIAKTLTERMGGRIGVEDNAGGGTHFWIELPFGVVDAAAEAMTAPLEDGAAPAIESVSGKVIAFDDPFMRHRLRVRRMQILVADDQPANRLVLQRLLERAGHSVHFAEDGEQTLDQMELSHPDLVVVDLHMPGMSGLDVIRQARVMQAGRSRTPIVVLSADATVEAVQSAERAGAYAFLTKPVVIERLLDTIGRIANDETAPAVAAAPPSPVRSDGSSVLQELATMDLGEDFLRQFVEQCLRDISRSMSQAQHASALADWDALRDAMHAMRGVAENLGAQALTERCRELMHFSNAVLATDGEYLTNDLDRLAELTATQTRAELVRLLVPGQDRSDPKPGPEQS